MTPESLRQCWDTLKEVADQYESWGEGWNTCIQAQRFIAIEMREQYGEAAFEELLGIPPDGEEQQPNRRSVNDVNSSAEGVHDMEATRRITAKFKVQYAERQGDYGTQIRLGVDYADGRNKEWAAATPWGEIAMTVKNEIAANEFRLGRSFSLTFDPEDD